MNLPKRWPKIRLVRELKAIQVVYYGRKWNHLYRLGLKWTHLRTRLTWTPREDGSDG